MLITKTTYKSNFIKGVRLFMAHDEIVDIKDAAKKLNLNKMTLYKIMDGTNNPTVAHGQNLCKKCGYSANWLFLNIGEIEIETQTTLNDLAKTVEKALKIKK